MRKLILMLCVILFSLAPLTGFTEADPEMENYTRYADYEPQKVDPIGLIPGEDQSRSEETTGMKMTIGETPVRVEWENNESVEALQDLAREGLMIQMSMYGGFEQVGSIGKSLPRNDRQTATSAGDIVLYSGNQLVVFYGSNSWSYTRLGKITDQSAENMRELLSRGDVVITLSAD